MLSTYNINAFDETRDLRTNNVCSARKRSLVPTKLCVCDGAVNVEIPKRKSRKRSGELGQHALRSIIGAGCSARSWTRPISENEPVSLLLTANAPHTEHREGICGSSCYAPRDLQRPSTLHLGPLPFPPRHPVPTICFSPDHP